jgi:hypothetical protein
MWSEVGNINGDSRFMSRIGEATLMTRSSSNPLEAELLLLCARSSQDLETTKRVRALLQKDLDWTHLLRMALEHRVTPLLYWNLNAICQENVPETALDQLRTNFRANSRRNLFLTGELLRLLNALKAREVAAIPYKGPTLALEAYRNLSFREFGDLDILVHKRDVPMAMNILASLGYQQQEHLVGAQEEAFFRSQCEFIFTNDHATVVELHWAIVPRRISFAFDSEALWTRLDQIELGGNTVSIFSPEDMLLILCVHGSKHRWKRLTWICDVAELIASHEDLDWEQVMAQAATLGGERMLLLGLFLTNELLGTNLPEHVVRRIKADEAVTILAGLVIEQLFRPGEDSQGIMDESSFRPLYLGMRESLLDRTRYCLHTAMSQTTEDWELVPLPRYFFPLYYLLRLVRLTGKYGRAFLQRALRRNS